MCGKEKEGDQTKANQTEVYVIIKDNYSVLLFTTNAWMPEQVALNWRCTKIDFPRFSYLIEIVYPCIYMYMYYIYKLSSPRILRSTQRNCNLLIYNTIPPTERS